MNDDETGGSGTRKRVAQKGKKNPLVKLQSEKSLVALKRKAGVCGMKEPSEKIEEAQSGGPWMKYENLGF